MCVYLMSSVLFGYVFLSLCDKQCNNDDDNDGDGGDDLFMLQCVLIVLAFFFFIINTFIIYKFQSYTLFHC